MTNKVIFSTLLVGAILTVTLAWTATAQAIGGHGKTTGASLPPPPKETGTGSGDTGQGKTPDPPQQKYAEPSTLLLGVFGIACTSVLRYRRRNKPATAVRQS